MTNPEIAAVVLLAIMSLLALVSGMLLYLLFARPSQPHPATPTPLPIPRQEYGGIVRYRSLTPSALRRPTTPRRQYPAVPMLGAASTADRRGRWPTTTPAAVLTVYNGPLRGSRFPLARPTLALGRSSLCDITIPDPRASRQHARLEWRRDGLYLVDTNSTNGTFVNRRRITQYRLQGGEQVQISDTIFTIHLY